MTLKTIENIKNDYLNGMTYKDIYKKHNITLSDLKKIIYKYNLTRNKSELYKGNQNAKKNKELAEKPTLFLQICHVDLYVYKCYNIQI